MFFRKRVIKYKVLAFSFNIKQMIHIKNEGHLRKEMWKLVNRLKFVQNFIRLYFIILRNRNKTFAQFISNFSHFMFLR